MDIVTHYEDEKWIHPAIRTLVLERDDYRCRRCGREDTGDLTLHHVIPRSSQGNHNPENLITLCVDCHYNKIHKYRLYVRRINNTWIFQDLDRLAVVRSYLRRRRARTPRSRPYYLFRGREVYRRKYGERGQDTSRTSAPRRESD